MTLFHRRADLSETMSDYLIHDLERAGVLVRGRSEIGALHGADGQLEAATLRDGERIPLSFLFLFLGAAPHTDWLGGTVALDDDGFVLAGQRAGAEGILETSVPGVFAVGDVRSGSVKRCATAVGEGAMVVRFVHERFSADVVEAPTDTARRRPPARRGLVGEQAGPGGWAGLLPLPACARAPAWVGRPGTDGGGGGRPPPPRGRAGGGRGDGRGGLRASPSHGATVGLAGAGPARPVPLRRDIARAAGVAVVAFPGKNGLIAFNSDGSVYVVSPNGSGLRLIAQTGIQDGYPGVSFSPDGKLITFSAMSATDPDIYTGAPGWVRRRPLTFSRGVDSDPTWSGDGKRIAFETNRNGNIDIYSVDRASR